MFLDGYVAQLDHRTGRDAAQVDEQLASGEASVGTTLLGLHAEQFHVVLASVQ